MKNNYCCKSMHDFLKEKKVCIGYEPSTREYYLNLNGSSAVQLIQFCPWCGAKLPKDLRDEYFEILKNEYNIKHVIGAFEKPNFPQEFKTDEWWKKRGL